MAQRNVKARYRVVGPQTVKVRTRVSRMVKLEGSNVPAKEDTFEDVVKEVFMVYFPQKHSIRVDKKELIRMGYHLKPRLVDMDSGETIDFGGDPYDFINDGDIVQHEDDPNYNYTLTDLIDEDEVDVDTDKLKATSGKDE